MIRIATVTLLTCFLSLCSLDAEDKYKLKLIDEFPLPELPEPSGLTWAESRGTLFAVGDEGHVAEISTDGEILNLDRLGSRDFEGVAFDPETSDLYVLDESLNSLLLLDPDTLTIKDELSLSVEWGPFEGLHMDEKRQFYLSEQITKKKKSGILLLSRDDKPRMIKTGILDQSAVLVQGENLYILSDSDNRLYCLNFQGKTLWDCNVKGDTQEGLAIDDEGFFYIAQDKGGILKMVLEEKKGD